MRVCCTVQEFESCLFIYLEYIHTAFIPPLNAHSLFFSKFIYIYKLNEESLSQRIVFVSFSVGFLATVGRKKIKIGFSSITRSRRRVTKDGDNKIYFERKKRVDGMIQFFY